MNSNNHYRELNCKTVAISKTQGDQSARQGQLGLRHLAQGHLGTTREEPGIRLATFWLQGNPLYLLS